MPLGTFTAHERALRASKNFLFLRHVTINRLFAFEGYNVACNYDGMWVGIMPERSRSKNKYLLLPMIPDILPLIPYISLHPLVSPLHFACISLAFHLHSTWIPLASFSPLTYFLLPLPAPSLQPITSRFCYG